MRSSAFPSWIAALALVGVQASYARGDAAPERRQLFGGLGDIGSEITSAISDFSGGNSDSAQAPSPGPAPSPEPAPAPAQQTSDDSSDSSNAPSPEPAPQPAFQPSPQPAPQPFAQWTPPSDDKVIKDLVKEGKLPRNGSSPITTTYVLNGGPFGSQHHTYTLTYTPMAPPPAQTTPATTSNDQQSGSGLFGNLVGSGGLIPNILQPTSSTSGTSEETEAAPATTSSSTYPAATTSTSSSTQAGLLDGVVGSNGLVPDVLAQPTPASSSQSTYQAPNNADVATSSSSSQPGLLNGVVGTNGLVPEVLAHPTGGSSSGSSGSNDQAQSSSSSSDSDPIIVGLNTILGNKPATTSQSPSAFTAAPAPAQNASSTGSGGLLGPLLGGSGGTGTSSSSTYEQTQSPGLLSGILSPETDGKDNGTATSSSSEAPGLLPDLLGPSTSTGAETANKTEAAGLVPGLLNPTPTSSMVTVSGTAGTFVVPAPTDGQGSGVFPSSTSKPGLVPGLLTGVGSLLDTSKTTSHESTPAAQPTAATNGTTGLPGLVSSLTSDLSLGSTPATQTGTSLTGTGGHTIPTSFTLSTSTGTDGTHAIPVPIPTSASTTNGTLPTNGTAIVPVPVEPKPTSAPTGSLPGSSPATSSDSASRLGSDSATKTTETPTTRAPFTIQATGTNTNTAMAVPTSIVLATPTSDIANAGSQGSTSSGSALPTFMPRLVQAPGGMPKVDTKFSLIQLGFNYGLNYPFVVNTENATNQIFLYLPKGVAHGLGLDESEVVMNALMPYDTSATLGYVTTLAQAYVPRDMMNALQQALHAPASPLYNSPQGPVKQLMSMVNPAIPLIPGASLSDGPATNVENLDASTPSGPGNGGVPLGGDSSSSQKVTGSTIGIGIGAVGAAAVYAAAMVVVARRYRAKKRAQRHQRNTSVPTAERGMRGMSQLSGGGMGSYFMSGANGRLSGTNSASGRSGLGMGSGSGSGRGSRNSGHSSNARSVRDQGISNPIMSENSLGWN